LQGLTINKKAALSRFPVSLPPETKKAASAREAAFFPEARQGRNSGTVGGLGREAAFFPEARQGEQ